MATILKLLPAKSAGRGKKISIGTSAGPSSYATGGFTYSTGLTTVDVSVVSANGGYVAYYNATTGKIVVYWTGATTSAVLAEVTATTNLSGVTFTVIAIGS